MTDQPLNAAQLQQVEKRSNALAQILFQSIDTRKWCADLVFRTRVPGDDFAALQAGTEALFAFVSQPAKTTAAQPTADQTDKP